MAYRIEDGKLPMWKRWLMALVGLTLAGCATAQEPKVVLYVVDPAARWGTTDAWPLAARRLPNVAADLQYCADHVAQGQRAALGSAFQMLRLEKDGLLVQPVQQYVGSQYVARLQDGEGVWYGRKEYRMVRFHCLQAEDGRVVYSFIRPL